MQLPQYLGEGAVSVNPPKQALPHLHWYVPPHCMDVVQYGHNRKAEREGRWGGG